MPNKSFLSLMPNPQSRKRLAEQLADALRAAIRNNRFRPGDLLPSFPALAQEARTSARIPREAIQLLVAEGLVATRRGVGTVVLKREIAARTRENVLIVHPNGHGAYYLGVLVEECDRQLSEAGYCVSRIATSKSATGAYDFRLLRKMLGSGDGTAALVFAYDDAVIAPIAASGIPYVVCTFRPIRYPGARGRIDYSHHTAYPAFIRHCRKSGVRRILLVNTLRWMLDVAPELEAEGFSVEPLDLPYPTVDVGKQESVERATFSALHDRLQHGNLPDLILFTDDFATRGGILALAQLGIRYPQDVKLVAWSNRHFGPVAPVTLTRMSMDPFAHAHTLSKAFLTFLRTGQLDKTPTLGPSYIKGQSFP